VIWISALVAPLIPLQDIDQLLEEFAPQQLLCALVCLLETTTEHLHLNQALAASSLLTTVTELTSASRLVSYNIHGDTAATSDVIRALDAHFILFQEVYQHSLGWLSKELNYPFQSFGGFNDTYGIGILSKWPILASHVITVPGLDHPRVLLIAECLVWSPHLSNLEILTIANVHLSPKDENLRLHQLDQMLSHTKAATIDLLGGDFNAISHTDYTPVELTAIPPDRSASQLVVPRLDHYGYQDCWLLAGGVDDPQDGNQAQTSKFTAHNSIRIDYIFCARDSLLEPDQTKSRRRLAVRPLQLRHLIDPSSDHLPVIFDFVIQQ